MERSLPVDRVARGTAHCDVAGAVDAAYVAAFASDIEAKLKAAIDRHFAKVEAIERHVNPQVSGGEWKPHVEQGS